MAGDDGIQLVDRGIELGVERIVVDEFSERSLAIGNGLSQSLQICCDGDDILFHRRIVDEFAERAAGLFRVSISVSILRIS